MNDNTAHIRISDTNGVVFPTACNDDLLIYTTKPSKILIGTSNITPKLIINQDIGNIIIPNGSFGIGAGISNPQSTLDVKGSFRVIGGPINLPNASIGTSIVSGLDQTLCNIVFSLSNLSNVRQYGGQYGSHWQTSTSSNAIYISYSNVGIGLSNPEYNLDVAGSVRIDGDLDIKNSLLMHGLELLPTDGQKQSMINSTVTLLEGYSYEEHGVSFTISSNTCNNYVRFLTQGDEIARFTGDGKFGIGTSNPRTNLDVFGNSIFQGVVGMVSLELAPNPTLGYAPPPTFGSIATSNIVVTSSTYGFCNDDKGISIYTAGNTSTDYIRLMMGTSNEVLRVSGGAMSTVTVGGHIIPSIPDAFDLGSLTNPFRSVYVGSSTLHIGGIRISENNGQLVVNNSKDPASFITTNLNSNSTDTMATASNTAFVACNIAITACNLAITAQVTATSASNVAFATSNISYPLSNVAYTACNIAVAARVTANSASNVAYATSNISYPLSNVAYTACNLAVTAQVTANSASSIAVSANTLAITTSNVAHSLSNYTYGQLSNASTGYWAPKASYVFTLSNVGIGTSNVTAPLTIQPTNTNVPNLNGLCVFNSNNTATIQHAIISAVTGGSLGGNPSLSLAITNAQGYSMAIDNADNDKLKISSHWAQVTPTMMTFDASTCNVGLFTSNPTCSLDVNGNMRASRLFVGNSNDPNASRLVAVLDTAMANNTSRSITLGKNNLTSNNAFVTYTHVADASSANSMALGIQGQTTPALTVLANGNVGINTITPLDRLHVSGNVRVGGTVNTGANALTCGAITTSGNITAIGNISTSGTINASGINSGVINSGEINAGTNALTCGAITSGAIAATDINFSGSLLKNGSPYEQEWGKCSTFYRGEWFQIQLPTPVIINSYVIHQTIAPVVFNGWVFLGSSDGLNWTLLDSNVLGSWTYGASPTTFTFTNSAAPMTHYRFVITHAPLNTVYVRGFSMNSAHGWSYPNDSDVGYIYNASSSSGEIVWDDDKFTEFGDIDDYGTYISITGYIGVLGTYTGQVPPTIVKSNAYLLDTSYNVGIGTNNPVYKLDVVGNARVSSSLLLGIGTNNPVYKLDVVGNARVSSSLLLGTSTDTSRAISALDGSMATGARYITLGKSPTTNNQAEFSYNHISDGAINNFASLGLYDNPNILNVMSSVGKGFGRIGVNMINPTYTLDVVGDINCTGNLLKNNIPFTTSQFTTSTNTSNVYIIGSNVGIGTSSPQNNLDVVGGIKCTSLAVNGANITASGQWTRSGANVYITSTNVGIGTTTPKTRLDVNGSVWISGNVEAYTGSITSQDISAQRNLTAKFCSIFSGKYSDSNGLKFLPVFGTDDYAYIQRYSPNNDQQTILEIVVGKDGNDHIILSPTGNVGIGTINPVAKLHVNGAVKATSYGNFTGHHDSYREMSSSNIGMIVISTGRHLTYIDGEIYLNHITISEALPETEICSKKNDPRVFGVVAGQTKKTNGSFESIQINSIGEGGIWVCDANGALLNGDYITTSSVHGHGEKQNEVYLCNYTVGKITQDCDFNPRTCVRTRAKVINAAYIYDKDGIIETEPCYDDNGQVLYESEYVMKYVSISGEYICQSEYETRLLNAKDVYRVAFVGCTYHCG
jgi:hypothetical protein